MQNTLQKKKNLLQMKKKKKLTKIKNKMKKVHKKKKMAMQEVVKGYLKLNMVKIKSKLSGGKKLKGSSSSGGGGSSSGGLRDHPRPKRPRGPPPGFRTAASEGRAAHPPAYFDEYDDDSAGGEGSESSPSQQTDDRDAKNQRALNRLKLLHEQENTRIIQHAVQAHRQAKLNQEKNKGENDERNGRESNGRPIKLFEKIRSSSSKLGGFVLSGPKKAVEKFHGLFS